MGELSTLQSAFTGHLRNPDQVPVPANLDKRRIGIYSELIFNNLSALLSDFFPVIKSILQPAIWDRMIRDFFISHQSQTPYFPKISGEFAEYLAQGQLTTGLPDFLVELSHYEWIELAIYTLDESIPAAPLSEKDLEHSPLALSALAVPLAYSYPVHQIRPDFQPGAPSDEPIHLLVFRDINESVRFFELQPLSFQLLNQIQETPGLIATDWLLECAEQLGSADKKQFISNGIALLKSFNEHHIFYIAES